MHYLGQVKMMKMRCNMNFWWCDAINTGIGIKWCGQCNQCHSYGQDDKSEVQYDMFGHVMPLSMAHVTDATTGTKVI